MTENTVSKYLPELPKEEIEQLFNRIKTDTKKLITEYTQKMLKTLNRPKSMQYFDEMADLYGKRLEEIRAFKENGGKVIGTTCMFVPQELIIASGALPVRIESGFYDSTKLGDRIVPVEVCPLVRSTIGISMANLHPFLELCDVIIIPNTCDGRTKLGEILNDRLPVWAINVPRLKDSPDSKIFWNNEVRKLKDKIEKFTGTKIKRKKLKDAADTTNRATEASRKFQSIRKDSPVIMGRDAMLVNQAAFYDDIKRWTDKTLELCKELGQLSSSRKPVCPEDTPRVLLTGSPMIWPDGWKIPNLIEEASPQGLIISDEFCSGDRVLYDPIGIDENTKSDIINAIAEKYLLPCTCPIFTSEEGNRDRIDRLMTLIKDYRIDGVVYHVLRGCHLYAMEYMRIKNLLAKENIPIYYLDTEYTREDVGQMKNRIDAFMEMLKAGAVSYD
jgi:benzoyl-CoA reductase/2-hydroxyglutaryl-CoA dehydratase subunit BcrC/BadD/HgdB